MGPLRDRWKFLALTVLLTVASCSEVTDAIKEGSMAVGAENQMMLVRREPPSLGYLRLETQKRDHPDIALFVKKKGLPDFLAEANNKSGHYFIFYHLRTRQAYICRTFTGEQEKVQFAGPYPITDREFRLLNGFRDEQRRQALKP